MKPVRLILEKTLQRTFQQTHLPSRPRLQPINRITQGATRQYSSSPLSRLVSKPTSRTPFYRHRAHTKRPQSTKPPFNPTPNLGSPEPSLSLSQRLRKLSREYGWSALGVYLLLSAVDFPLCFAAVRLLGTDRIGHWEHVIVERFWMVVEMVVPNVRSQEGQARVEEGVEGVGEAVEGVYADGDAQLGEMRVAAIDHGVKEAEQRNKAEASIWTQLALAYAIHKSFIFIRVPLTAALTPKVVRVLRGWGWDIGKRKPKAVKGTKN